MKKALKYFALAIALHISLVNASNESDWNLEHAEIMLTNLKELQAYQKEKIIPFNMLSELEDCSKNGNIFCARELAEFYYYDLKDSRSAFPFLQKHANWLEEKLSKCENKVKDDWTKLICEARSSYIVTGTFENLSAIYFAGEGAIQNYDKAIYYGKLAANQGDSYGAYMVYLSYLNKTRPMNKSSDLEADIINSYAWLRVALAMGIKSNFDNPDEDGKTLDFSLDLLLVKLASIDKTQKANSLALDLCNSIKGCNI